MAAAAEYDAVGAQGMGFLVSEGVVVVDHEYAVEYGDAEEGDEAYAGRDTEGETSQP